MNRKSQNENYVVVEAALVEVTGKSIKDQLLSTPFIRVFDLGQNLDGYWWIYYSHMAVQQTEDWLHAAWTVPLATTCYLTILLVIARREK